MACPRTRTKYVRRPRLTVDDGSDNRLFQVPQANSSGGGVARVRVRSGARGQRGRSGADAVRGTVQLLRLMAGRPWERSFVMMCEWERPVAGSQ